MLPSCGLGVLFVTGNLLNGWQTMRGLRRHFYVSPTLPTIPIIAPHTLSYTVNVVNKGVTT